MTQQLLLGYDIGSSSIKTSLVDANTGNLVSSASSPDQEMKIDSPQSGWAEQHPDMWWHHLVAATKKMLAKIPGGNNEVIAIGISYQMHGLVMVDRDSRVLYPSIIWCDSRAVGIGNKAFEDLGPDYCLRTFLNSPGNFTASKLKWVKENRKEIYSKVFKIMLPGDFIAMKLTGEICTTISGLSEGIFWDFTSKKVSEKLLSYYGFEMEVLSPVVPTFGVQGTLTPAAAGELGLKPGISISYRAGDQPNNALSLNVLRSGEIAATAGTSGVIYGVTEKNIFDNDSRVNTFAHVNYSDKKPSNGVLLCINGTGIQYSWIKHSLLDDRHTYEEMNLIASKAPIGSGGLLCHPFGNGAERVLKNKDVQARFSGINFNIHGKEHFIRSAQEGIAFAFKYGFDVMKKIGMDFNVIRAGNSNLFQSPVFKEAFVNLCNVNLEVYNTDGSQGAARGAGIGAAFYSSPDNAFSGLKVLEKINPETELSKQYNYAYQVWKSSLDKIVEN